MSNKVMRWVTILGLGYGALKIAPVVPRQTASAQSSATTSQKDTSSLRFLPGTVRGEMLLDGVKLGSSTYKASDGVTLVVLYNNFEDPQHAIDVFNQEIAKASKIMVRDKKIDRSGKAVGERARVLMPGSKPNEILYSVLWTDGKAFREIYSTSERDTRALEKVYN
ncbi:MAG TPA: hypothetical protein VMB02_09920 [Candidatus Aquilonibacter sp.]|nr:hypothetical protein [Candidatus Aquilonibacter sp.]